MPEEISSRNENIRKEEDKCARKRANYKRAAVVSLTVTLASLSLSIPKIADHFLTFWYGPSSKPAVIERAIEEQHRLMEHLRYFGDIDLGNISNLEYALKAKIDGKEIRFYRRVEGKYNILDVIEAEGGVVRYVDKDDDLKVDDEHLINNLSSDGRIYMNHESTIDDPPLHNNPIRRAQKRFKDYLAKLMELHKQDIIIAGGQSN